MCENVKKYRHIVQNVKNDQVKKLFTTLAKVEVELCKISQSIPDQAILVVRNANSGQRTFTRWLAGQDSKFESKSDEKHPGEYVISDVEGGAHEPQPTCVSISESDPEAGVFCDFPVFASPKGTAYDIAETYFTKKSIENISSVKLCFLIEYYRMTSSGERRDLQNYLKHVVELMGDYEKIENSVLLVVSKVPSALSTFPDNEIIATLILAIQNLKKELAQQAVHDGVDNSKIIDFIDLFIAKEQNTYPRLALFRSPNQQGPLSNISSLQENKRGINEKLENRTFFETTGTDFGYSISESSFYKIPIWIEELRDSIVVDVKISGTKIQQYFAAKEAAIEATALHTYTRHMYEQMTSAYQEMLAIKMSAVTSGNLTQCLNRIIDGVAKMTDNSIILDLSFSLDSTEGLQLLHTIAGGQSNELSWCADGLADIIRYLDDSRKWYHFANSLYVRLINCDISTNMGIYNITDEEILEQVSRTNLNEFLHRNALEEQLFVQYNDVKDVVLTEFKLESAKLIASQVTKYRQSNEACLPNAQKHPSIGDIYATLDYLNDLYFLENQVYALPNRTVYVPHYQSLYARVEDYLEKRVASKETSYIGDFGALNYLLITILSRIQSINSRYDDYVVVVDVEGYFSTIEKQILGYKTVLKQVQIEDHRNEYSEKIASLIVEANDVLESILPEIDNINAHIDYEIARLIAVVQQWQEEGEKKEQELKDAQGSLALCVFLRVVSAVMKVGSVLATFTGPWGPILGAAIGAGSSALDTYLNHKEGKISALLQTIDTYTNLMKNVYPLEQQNLAENFDDVLNKVRDIIENDDALKNLTLSMCDLVKMAKPIDAEAYWSLKEKLKKDVRYFNSVEVPKETAETLKERKKEFADNVEKMMTAVESGVSGVVQVNKLVSQSGDQLQKIRDSVNNLKAVEYSMMKQLLPQVNTLKADLTNVLRNSGGQSHAVLDRTNLLSQNLILDFKNSINSFSLVPTAGKPIVQNILTCIEKLQIGISTSIKIYDRIQDYGDQSRLAELIYKLQSPGSSEYDPALKMQIEKLDLQIKANLILQEYRKAIAAFKQYMFPFAERYLPRYNVTSFLQPRDLDDMVNSAAQQINQLRIEMSVLTQTHGKLPIFQHVRFDEEDVDQKSFYTWHHDTHGEQITKLLRGLEVILEADITQIRSAVNVNLNAIKFNEIGIRFLSQNKTIENHIHRLMINFQVQLVHMGDSHYRCDDEYYVFNHNLIRMRHAANSHRDATGKPTYSYSDSGHLKRNAPIFSPFAKWRILLYGRSAVINQTSKKVFKSLEIFHREPISLALEGQGSHIPFPFKESCHSGLKNHYQLVGKFPHVEPPNEYTNNDPNALFATNSANGIRSSINIAFNWLMGASWCIKPFWIADGIIKDEFRSILSVSPTEDHTSAATTSAKFNVFESLTLADFLIRWITKAKPYTNRVAESMNSIEITAFVLNLVEQAENLILPFNLPDESATPFDALTLIHRLENELMINGNVTAIKNVLYQAVVDANPRLGYAPFRGHIRQQIAEILLG